MTHNLSAVNTSQSQNPIIVNPEDCLRVADFASGVQLDAMDTTIGRAEALLMMLSGQFDNPGTSRISDNHMSDAIDAVRGQLATLTTLVRHGFMVQQSQPKRKTPAATKAYEALDPLEALHNHMQAVDDLIQRIGDDDDLDAITRKIFEAISDVIDNAKSWLDKYHPQPKSPGVISCTDYHDNICTCFAKMQFICSILLRSENGPCDMPVAFRIFFDEMAEVGRIVNRLQGQPTDQ